MALHTHMALGIDIEMAPSKTKFQACWQNHLLMSQILFCFGLFSSPKLIFILPNKVMLWGRGAYRRLFCCCFFAPSTKHPIGCCCKESKDSSFCTLRSLLKTLLSPSKITILMKYYDFLCILMTAVVVCCCLLALPCIYLFVLHFM